MLSDEEYGAALLRPLDREPTGPSTVDVMRAVEDARRYRRRAGVAGVAGVVAVTALVVSGGVAAVGWGRHAPVDARPPAASATTLASPSPSAPAGPTGCTMQRLPVPAGQPPKSIVTGGDPTGRYLLGRSYPGGQSHPLLIWDNGQVRTVAMQGEDQELVDINSTGTVAVGSSFIGPDSGEQVAWVYHDGLTTRLPGGGGYASSVNDHGVIAGTVGDKPAMWPSATSAPTMLSLPAPGWVGSVNAIDEDGTMVGQVSDGKNPDSSVAYLWHPDGTGERLPVPVANGQPVTSYLARAIRGDWVVGWASLSVDRGSYIYAPRWNLRTGEVDVSFPGLANAVNAQGWIAGDSQWHAAIGGPGAPLILPDLATTDRFAINIAYTISDDGAVSAGQVQSANGDPVAVEWHCH